MTDADSIDAQTVLQPAQILALLRRVLEARALLTVSLTGADRLYSSALLDVNPSQSFILLDELNPAEGHTRLLETRALRADASLQGVDLSFRCELLDIAEHNGIALYKLAMPELVRYRQRRAAHRAPLGPALHVPIDLGQDPNHHDQGLLLDISAGGLGARLTAETPLTLAKGVVLPDCHLTLPTGDALSGSLEVRFVGPDRQQTKLRVGARFVDLDRHQTTVLEHFVAALERDIIKRLRRGGG